MNKILNCNISKLMDTAAIIWKNRFKTIIKISYFRGIGAKPHTLLFEINPECNPKEDFAFEILNSFSQRYKSIIADRAKLLEVGNRAELIETCINPDPEFPDVYIKEWKIFVKLDDLYFEKQFNDLSGEFIILSPPIELKKDFSPDRIIEWNHFYFLNQVAPESEIILYPIKPNKYEKFKQGLKKEVAIPGDNHLKYISGGKLIERWNGEEFQIFEYIKDGLQPYASSGKKIVDLKTLELSKKFTEDEIIERIGIEDGDHRTQKVLGAPHSGPIRKKLTVEEIAKKAKIEYAKQPLDKPIVPDDSIAKDLYLPIDEREAAAKIKKAMSFRFKMDDVIRYEAVNLLSIDDSDLTTKEDQCLEDGSQNTIGQNTDSMVTDLQSLLPCAPGTQWGDITITLTSKDQLRIKTLSGEKLYNYAEIGMQDERNTEKKKRIWALLVLFAQKQGILDSEAIENHKKIFESSGKQELYDKFMTVTKELNKHLKDLFGIDGSIYIGTHDKMYGNIKNLKKYCPKLFEGEGTYNEIQKIEQKKVIDGLLKKTGYATKIKLVSKLHYSPDPVEEKSLHEQALDNANRLINQR